MLAVSQRAGAQVLAVNLQTVGEVPSHSAAQAPLDGLHAGRGLGARTLGCGCPEVTVEQVPSLPGKSQAWH